MKTTRVFHGVLLLSIVTILLPIAPAQKSGQSGSGSGGSSGSSGGSGSTGSTGSKTGPTTGSRNTPTTQPVIKPQPEQERRRLPYISGSVVMGDGTPLPMGIVIERTCNGRRTKEAYVDHNGYFSFQIGAARSIMMDASDDGWGASDSPWNPSMRSSGIQPAMGAGSFVSLVGCELRAQLAGYRSSVVILNGSQMAGPMMDVGTIVLYPIAQVQGTTVSVTNLRAPKEAKKAFERGEKALRKKKLEEAEKNLRAAVDIYPKFAGAWFTLGWVYRQENRIADARLAFSKAMEADGNYVNPYIELARLAAQEQKWELVADLTQHALALDPVDFPDGFFLDGVANYYLNKLDAAESSAKKAQRLDPLHSLPQTHLLMANILRRKQDNAGEADQLRSYLKYAPRADNIPQVRSRLTDLEKAGGVVADKQPPQE